MHADSYQFFTALKFNGTHLYENGGKTVMEFLPINSNSRSRLSNIESAEAQSAAMKLEASFLVEMLKAAGLGTQKNNFSGGNGEDQFASFHRQAIADKIAAAGGIGLAEHFLTSMMEINK